MKRVLGLALYGSLAASTRYRLMQYEESFKSAGLSLEVFSLLGNDYLESRFADKKVSWGVIAKSISRRLVSLLDQGNYDCAILYSELFPFLPGFIDSNLIRIPFVYDFDDAFFLRYVPEDSRLSWYLEHKFDRVISKAAAVTAGNSYLVDYAKARNDHVVFLPTVVDVNRYSVIGSSSEDHVFHIGWIGSPSTAPYLNEIVGVLEQIGREGSVRLTVIGGKAPVIENVDVRELPWSESTEVQQINEFDVGIMPLPKSEWSLGKCAFKLIQYMACGVPVVGSRIGANVEVVDHGSGFLADSEDEWLNAFRSLRDDADLRLEMGRQARQHIEKDYSLQAYAKVFSDTVNSIT